MKKRLAILAACCLIFVGQSAEAKIYKSGDPEKPQIALTIDDCNHLDILAEMLDLFAAEDIHCTFFVLGNVLKEEDAAIWQRVLAEGHQIGNHTFGHPSLTTSNQQQITSQLRRTQKALNKVLGYVYSMQLMRPPYGKCYVNATQLKIKRAGYENIILWTISQTDPDKAFEAVENGSILLFHTNEKDLECLRVLIPRLKQAGFEPVTVSELLELNVQ